MSSEILVTGFEPFGGEKINPSQEILKVLSEDKECSDRCDFKLLPVDYKKGPEVLLKTWRAKKYQAWLGLGQAGGRAKISLERVAINWKEVDFNVRDGEKIVPEVLIADASHAHINNLDLHQLKSVILEKQIPCEISVSAGAYICNAVYYHWLNETRGLVPGLFVHVPYLPEQHRDRPHIELSKMIEATRLIISQLI